MRIIFCKNISCSQLNLASYMNYRAYAGGVSFSFTTGNSRIITGVGHFECINSDTHNTF